MTAELGTKRLAVVGAAGRQGATAVDLLLRSADRPAGVVAIDVGFDAARAAAFRELGAAVHAVDVQSERDALGRILADVDLVINLSGPFHALGTAVLETAIEARCDYLDICDDADAAAAAIALDRDAARAGIRALIGAGSAPGLTNVLGRVALAAAGGFDEARLLIAWATPVEDLSESIYRHICHCLRTPVPGRPAARSWQDLAPEPITFLDPVGTLETVLFGHPEPLTFRHYLGVEATLRGATVPGTLMHAAWLMAGDAHAGRAAAAGDGDFGAFRAAVGRIASREVAPSGALHIEAWGPAGGIRLQTVSEESMEATTVGPCLAFSRLILAGQLPRAGVLSPEMLDPRRFFSSGIARGRGRMFASRLRADGSAEPVSFRALLEHGHEAPVRRVV